MKFMMNMPKYESGHWSTVSESEFGLAIYLKQYESIYNKTNIDRLLSLAPKEPVSILDYGGGCGMLSISLAKMGHRVTLVDASELAINTAMHFAKLEQVEIEAKSAASLYDAKIDKKFDIIFAKDLIEHIVDDSRLVREFAGALNKQGVLIMTTQNSFSLNYILEAGIRKILRPKDRWLGWDRTHLRFYTPRKLRALVESSGLKLDHFRSGYVFPYKLLARFLPSMDPHKKSVFSEFDRFISGVGLFSKLGWNIMVIAKQQDQSNG